VAIVEKKVDEKRADENKVDAANIVSANVEHFARLSRLAVRYKKSH